MWASETDENCKMPIKTIKTFPCKAMVALLKTWWNTCRCQ